jgi:hypothetical protein
MLSRKHYDRDMKNSVRVVKRYRAEEIESCHCCGRKITKVEVLETGDKVGSECSALLEFPVYRIGRTLTKKQTAFFKQVGVAA